MWIQIALTAIAAASLPLAVIFWSKDHNKRRKLAFVTLSLIFELIMFGAFTRLTDSGLGCPDWPGCYGQSNPLQSHADIRAAQEAMPHGPVTLQKAWIEMIHRYLAMSVGILLIVQLGIALWRRRQSQESPWSALFLLLFVCLQGAFGAWTVTLKLQPVIVTTHLLLGMGLLALQALQAERYRPAPAPLQSRFSIWPLRLALLTVFLQIALGGWVSTNYAALACHDYPLCNGSLVPEMDWQHGFTLWRQLGQTASGDYLPFTALVAIQWAHRSFAWLVALVVGLAIWQAGKQAALAQLCRWVGAALALQILLGISTVYFAWPLLLAVLHNGGAATLVLLLSMLNYRAMRASRAPAL